MARKSVPESHSVNLSTSAGQDKLEGNYFKNCNNTYYIQRQAILKGVAGKSNNSKLKCSQGICPSSKRKPISQAGLNVPGLIGMSKYKNRSNSKQNISDSKPLAILSDHPILAKKVKKPIIG